VSEEVQEKEGKEVESGYFLFLFIKGKKKREIIKKNGKEKKRKGKKKKAVIIFPLISGLWHGGGEKEEGKGKEGEVGGTLSLPTSPKGEQGKRRKKCRTKPDFNNPFLLPAKKKEKRAGEGE